MDLEALRQGRKDYAAQLNPERRPIGILFYVTYFCIYVWSLGFWSQAGLACPGIQFQLTGIEFLYMLHLGESPNAVVINSNVQGIVE